MASTVTELLRRRFRGKSLPYDAEVEYLQSSTSGEIIDTGVGGLDVDAIEIKYLVGRWFSYCSLFGNYINEQSNVWRILQSKNQSSAKNVGVYVGARASNGWNSVAGGERNIEHTIYMSATSIICDGVQFSGTIVKPQGTQNASNIVLFARNLTSPMWYDTEMRCYYFKAWRNNNLVCDLIPCRIGQKGYMYDRVSGSMIEAYGGGNFILGNDK